MSSSAREYPFPPAWMVLGLTLYLALAIFSEYWLWILTDHPLGSDLRIYLDAYRDARAGGNPYDPYQVGATFVNHPLLLSLSGLFAGAGGLSRSAGQWILVSALAWCASIKICHGLLRDSNAVSHSTAPGGALIAGVLLLAFVPVWEGLHVGQINAFALLALLALALADAKRNAMLTGLFLALAIALKTSPLLFVLYFVALRRVRPLLFALGGGLVLSVVPLLQFGPQVLLDFAAILPELGAEIHPSKFNQSLLSMLERQFAGLDWEGKRVAFRVVHQLALFGALLALLWPARRARSLTRRDELWLFAGLLTIMTVFSPLVWQHHSMFLLLPLWLLLSSPLRSRVWWGVGILGIIQSERLFEQLVSRNPWPILIAHIALLVLMTRESRRRTRAAGRSSTTSETAA